VSSLKAVDRHTFAVELLKAVQDRDTAQLIELVEDW
jgi:hypothetical protein